MTQRNTNISRFDDDFTVIESKKDLGHDNVVIFVTNECYVMECYVVPTSYLSVTYNYLLKIDNLTYQECRTIGEEYGNVYIMTHARLGYIPKSDLLDRFKRKRMTINKYYNTWAKYKDMNYNEGCNKVVCLRIK